MLELQDPRVKMARFSVEFEVTNNRDLILAQDGHMKKDDVRRLTIRGLVDPGAARLVLPLSVVKRLGVPKVERTKTKYADGRVGQRDVVDEVRVNLLGRSGVFRAIVEPKRDSALIGAIVLEDLDFMVDCKLEKLVPRDPKQIVSEIE
jgi:predicted aspartyl protease